MRHPRALLHATPDLQLGELAVTYGFPLRGLLASEGNLTSGYVTALGGLRDNKNYIQVSTPIQPGNSGGALLDSSGNVIGVVASSLNDVALLRATGSLPQNVNFAIKVDTLRQFLQRAGANVAEEHSGDPREMKDIGARARMFTSLIECHDGTE
jgi:S1-C subfamily serine protease